MSAKAAIAIDDWKLPIFKRHLEAAGYTFTQSVGFTPSTLLLAVAHDDLGALHGVVKAANTEAAYCAPNQ